MADTDTDADTAGDDEGAAEGRRRRPQAQGQGKKGQGHGGTGGARDGGGATLPVIRPDVAGLARQHHLGEHRATIVLGGGDIGCVAVVAAFGLLPPGIGLLIGPYATLGTTIGAVLLALAVAVPVLAFRYESHRAERIPRLHVFDGGLVLTHPGTHRTAAHPWRDLRTVERTRFVTVGQAGTPRTVHRLELHVRGGPLLCSVGGVHDTALIRRLAAAGGAQV